MIFQSAAFFDVDGTLLRATIVHYFLYLKTRNMSGVAASLWRLLFLSKVPFYWLVDQWSRPRFNTLFYRHYRGFLIERLREDADFMYRDFMTPRLFSEAIDRIRWHQAQGHAVVLVSGSLDVLLQPLARRLGVTRLCAAGLEVEGGVCTGNLTEGPMTGEKKAEAICGFANEYGLDLNCCFAYADSLDDRYMLETTGCAAVVNPGARLRRLALERGWEVMHWKQSSI